ncbi:outer membrane protein assembly factor BamA [Haloferula luteola]|uniref:Outer membrane protein assembly factor BamA n=1 Tax=Haloferula luteola TaxID=595692 RepID=A0A840VBF4_9BACT|nr:BamA/TamA family outer membrane protein [Haloferula luteola]MBB5352008.1 outer membrane protein assembly factor BamA [Haloferula luteola]
MKPSLPITAALLLPLCAIAKDTEIRVIGAKSISEGELLSALAGRLDHIRNNPATPPRAADAAFLIEQTLHNAGFNQATLYWKILSPELIQIRIEEGPRDLLGSIEVLGIPNKHLYETLVDLFKLRPSQRATGFSDIPLEEGDDEEGMALMQRQMQSLGFYHSKISVASRTNNPDTGKVDFVIKIDSGPMAVIAPPQLEGQMAPGTREALTSVTGQPASTANLNLLRSKVEQTYQNEGFLRAEVRMRLDAWDNQVRPQFTVTEGEQLILHDIRIAGTEKTNPERITIRLQDLKGVPIDGNLARDRISDLVSTGAFSSVRTDLENVAPGQVDALITIAEADARGISTHVGFDSYEGALVGAGYYDRNLWGRILNLSSGFEASQRSLLGEVSISDPWIRGSDLSGKVRLFANTRDNEGYDVLRMGLEGGVVWPITEAYDLEASIGWSYNHLTEDGLFPSELGETSYQNPFIRLSQKLDHRDNPVLPTKGWHIETPLELGAAIGNESSSYAKLGVESSYHHPIGSGGQLSLGFRNHLLIPLSGADRLPIDLRLFNGGARSVRSFRERELGPWSYTGYPVGGQASWVANVEYSQLIAGPMRAVAFVDAGGLTRKWEDFGFDDPKIAIGLGLRLDLPIGPVRFEYGHNLTRDGHDPSGTFHFAIGTAF